MPYFFSSSAAFVFIANTQRTGQRKSCVSENKIGKCGMSKDGENKYQNSVLLTSDAFTNISFPFISSSLRPFPYVGQADWSSSWEMACCRDWEPGGHQDCPLAKAQWTKTNKKKTHIHHCMWLIRAAGWHLQGWVDFVWVCICSVFAGPASGIGRIDKYKGVQGV